MQTAPGKRGGVMCTTVRDALRTCGFLVSAALADATAGVECRPSQLLIASCGGASNKNNACLCHPASCHRLGNTRSPPFGPPAKLCQAGDQMRHCLRSFAEHSERRISRKPLPFYSSCCTALHILSALFLYAFHIFSLRLQVILSCCHLAVLPGL